MRHLLVLALLVSALGAEETPAERAPEKALPGAVEIPDPGTPIEDAAVAKQEVARFTEAIAKASTDEERVELITRLGAWDHSNVLRAASKYLRNRREPIAVAAVVACARQSASRKKAGSTLARSFNSEKREPVSCALIVGLGRLGYKKTATYKEIEKIFRKERGERRKAAARYFGYLQDKKAFRMLAEKLDEPRFDLPPQDKDKKRKLPVLTEEQKRERWEQWKSNFPFIQWALSRIVPGETFEATGEAREWALTDGKKAGITW